MDDCRWSWVILETEDWILLSIPWYSFCHRMVSTCVHTQIILFFFSSLKLFNFLDELFLSAAGLEWIWRSSSSPWSASKGEVPLRTVSYGRNVVLSRWAGLKLLPCPEVVHEFWAAALLSHIWRVLNRLVTRQTEVSIQWNVFPRSLSQVLS